MMVLSALAAVTSAHMTFICAPHDDARRNEPYVVSFQRNGDRLRHIWVIWPNGSQSENTWTGRVVDDHFVIRSKRGSTVNELTLKLDAGQPNRADLTSYFAVMEGHTPMQQSDDATCSVRIAGTGA